MSLDGHLTQQTITNPGTRGLYIHPSFAHPSCLELPFDQWSGFWKTGILCLFENPEWKSISQ